MKKSTLINFSNDSNRDLESSLSSINRDKFEHNYQACLVEVEKRKKDGTWYENVEIEKKSNISKIHKWIRGFALIQAIGGVIGVANYIYIYGPYFLGGLHWLTMVLAVVAIFVFSLTTWAGWKYWQTENESAVWRFLLYMQIPGFLISSVSYKFFSGFHISIGYIHNQFEVSSNIASNMTINWSPQSEGFSLTINIAPIIALGMLNASQRYMKNNKVEQKKCLINFIYNW